MIIALLLLVLITGFFVCAEIAYERDWPRSTIKGFLIALALLFMGLQAFGQTASRYDQVVSTINQSAPAPGGLYPALYIPNSGIAICTAPVNAVPCTNFATTYVNAAETLTCTAPAQLTRPGSNTCVAGADSEGGFGVWMAPGTYQYTITTTYGSFGPYDFTVAGTSSGGGGGGGGVNPSAVPLPLAYYPAPAPSNNVSPTLINPTTPGPSWTPGTNQFSAPNVYGDIAPGTYTQPYNRDNTINGLGSPNDFGSAGNGTNEQGDDAQAVIQSIQRAAVNQQAGGKVVHLLGRNYRAPVAHAMILGPRDFGDYNTTSAGTGALVGLVIDPTTGGITSCSVSWDGTVHYNPSATLQVQIQDLTYTGSGGAAHVTTDGSGVPSTCVVDLPGMLYPTSGYVLANVIPIGADGATGNCGTLVGGQLPSTTCTVTAGGWGYAVAPPCGLAWGTAQLQGTPPTVTCTVTGNQITGITVSTVGSGLTWNGSSTGGPVTVCIGACVNGVQATNIAPEPPISIPCAIPLRQGVSIDGEGATFQADYNQGTADLNQMVLFCDPWGTQGQNISFRNFGVAGFGGFWFTGQINNVVWENITSAAQEFSNPPSQSTGSPFGIYAAQMGHGVVIKDSMGLSKVPIICGGQWDSRTGGAGGSGSMGGWDASTKITPSVGGSCDGAQINNSDVYTYVQNQLGYQSYYQKPNTVYPFNNPIGYNWDSALDLFFEQYVYKSQNTSLTNPYSWDGSGLCYSTLTNSPRNTDFNYGNIAAKLSTYPWFNCYRGVSDMGFVAWSRYGYASRVNIAGLNVSNGSDRPVVAGNLDQSLIANVATTFARHYVDPYICSGCKTPGVVTIQAAATTYNTLFGIKNGDTSRGAYNQTLGIFTLQNADTNGTIWNGVTPTAATSQTAQNVPLAGNLTVNGNLNVTGTTTGTGGASFLGYNSSSGAGTVTVGAAAGGGATAVCHAGSPCDNATGWIDITAGSSPTTVGVLVTVTFAATRAQQPGCVANLNDEALDVAIPMYPGATPLALTVVGSGTALTATHVYRLSYWCGGQ